MSIYYTKDFYNRKTYSDWQCDFQNNAWVSVGVIYYRWMRTADKSKIEVGDNRIVWSFLSIADRGQNKSNLISFESAADTTAGLLALAAMTALI